MTARNFYLPGARFEAAPDLSGTPVAGLAIVRRLAHSEREWKYRTVCKCGNERVIGHGHLKSIIARGEYRGCMSCRSPKIRPVGAFVRSRVHETKPKVEREARKICWECAGLPHRRPARGCRKCGEPFEAEAPVTVEDVLRQPVASRRELV